MHLALITVLVPTYDEAIDFFTNALGFDLLEDSKVSDTKRWVRVAPPMQQAGAQTALLLAQPKNDTERAAIGNQTGGRVGFFLHTDDFAAAHASMTEAGVRFLEAPRHEPYGTVAVFTDPWGNTWDLIEPAP
ncbi:MAG: VOC family protein [Pseudomonadota bacterium]